MTTVLNKHILFIGEETSQVEEFKRELENRGVKIFSYDCSVLTIDYIQSNKIDLIIYNHVVEDDLCDNLKKLLTNEHLGKVLPIFSIVEDIETDIQLALTYGIADFITTNEDVVTVIQKIEAVFSEDEIFSGGSAIDISPIEADISSTGIKVFVVEDDPLLRNLLSMRLDKSGFPYEFSKDGKEVTTLIKQFKPDLIILDLMLPGISGFEVLEQIKADKEISTIPVLVFSNKDGIEDRERAKSLGANDFYVKAMTDLSELMESIETLVNKVKQ